jgi:hypothetical protein
LLVVVLVEIIKLDLLKMVVEVVLVDSELALLCH